MPRYLFGPVTDAYARELIGSHLDKGDCISFDTSGSLSFEPNEPWESFAARIPDGWSADFIVLYLTCRQIPRAAWEAPVPVIALAPDWNRQWHFYRRACRQCELVLTDAKGVETFHREGIAHARQAMLFGLDQSWMEPGEPVPKRDIDILFIGNFHPVIQAERLPWLARLAALGERWNVTLLTNVHGQEYRGAMRRSRIVFNRSLRGECNKRTFEAAAAGALLFQEAENLEIRDFFDDGRECILYSEENLESLLTHYLENERERQRLAAAAQERCRAYSFEQLWTKQLGDIEAALPELIRRRQDRPAGEVDLSTRLWGLFDSADTVDSQLLHELEQASAEGAEPADNVNELGVARVLAGDGRADAAFGDFERAIAREPGHLVARLNLAVAKSIAGQRQEAIREAVDALKLIETDPDSVKAPRDSSILPRAFNHFRVEWERAAYLSAGQPMAERQAKISLIKWRLHSLLAELTGLLSQHYEAVLERSDLAPSRSNLAEALTRNGQLTEAAPHWRHAWMANPFDGRVAQRLFESLKDMPAEQRRVASRMRQLHQVAPALVPAQNWFLDLRPTGAELASIIILCCNEIEVTRLCLESVLRQTRRPYELILVDNGSTDETPQYLESIKTRPGPSRIEVIRNEANLGFAKGCNQALAQAAGDYLVLLNNDTVVTPQWLDNLIGWSLHDWPSVGMVGPTTNYASPPQQINAGYTDLADLDAFAQRRATEYAGKAMTYDRLTGFCLLIRRDVLRAIGGLDERFGVGFFEDDDLCVRVRKAGYKLLVALNAYIHHFGSRTFASLGIDCETKLRENLEVFKAKWGEEYGAPYRLPTEPPKQVPQPEPMPPPAPAVIASNQVIGWTANNRPRVSLTMIVKNEEHNLGDCLRSVADLVDEIIVVDTGSTDRTKDIAREFNAKVFDFPWVDSFAAARNEALRYATGDWIFWMDADDRLDEANRERLHSLFTTLPTGQVVGFVMKCSCLPDSETGSPTVVDHVRLFPNHPQIRWKYRIHEQILVSIRALSGDARWCDVVIQHVGYMDAQVRERKLQRDIRLLTLENDQHPGDPFTLFNLGSVFLEQGNRAEALKVLQRSLALSRPADSIVRKLYSQIIQCQRQLGQAREALATCDEARQHYPDNMEILFQESLVRHQLGDRKAAIATLERLLSSREGDHFASVDAGLKGHKTRHNLGAWLCEDGRHHEAEEQWRLALREEPSFLPTLVSLAQFGIDRGRPELVDEMMPRLDRHPQGRVEAALLRGRVHLAKKNFLEARRMVEELLTQHPKAVHLHQFLSHVLLQEGHDWPAAERVLRNILALDPNHTEAKKNLAVLEQRR